MGEEGVNVHVGERVGPFVVVANESTIPARKRRVVVRCVVCERVSEMNERSLLDKRTEEQRACAKCRVYTTNGTWTKGWRAKMENAAAEANRLNEENARLRDEIDKVLRERDLALERLENEIKAANQARMAEERARESLDELDAAIYDCLPSDYDDDSPLDCVEHAADRLRELAEERDEARREADRFRHGCTVEGDFVCPNEYAVSELTAERNFLRALKKNHEEDFTRVCKERDEARAEVERLRIALLEVQTSESAPAWFADGFHDGWKAGAEAMRKRCEELVKHNSHEDGIGMGSQRIESAIRAMRIPEEP